MSSTMLNFQNSQKLLSELKRPHIDQQLDIKSRVSVLEEIVVFHEKINPLNVELVENVLNEMSEVEARLMQLIEQNHQNAATEIAELKRHYNHRYPSLIITRLTSHPTIDKIKQLTPSNTFECHPSDLISR